MRKHQNRLSYALFRVESLSDPKHTVLDKDPGSPYPPYDEGLDQWGNFAHCYSDLMRAAFPKLVWHFINIDIICFRPNF